jgi:hypothetical protein
VPASARQVGWDQDAAEHVLTAANGAPFLLQLYGDAYGMFRGRWNRASPVEQQDMVAMAQHMDQEGTAGTGQVAAALGRPLANLSYVRTRLLDKGLIQAIGYGRVAFSLVRGLRVDRGRGAVMIRLRPADGFLAEAGLCRAAPGDDRRRPPSRHWRVGTGHR